MHAHVCTRAFVGGNKQMNDTRSQSLTISAVAFFMASSFGKQGRLLCKRISQIINQMNLHA